MSLVIADLQHGQPTAGANAELGRDRLSPEFEQVDLGAPQGVVAMRQQLVERAAIPGQRDRTTSLGLPAGRFHS